MAACTFKVPPRPGQQARVHRLYLALVPLAALTLSDSGPESCRQASTLFSSRSIMTSFSLSPSLQSSANLHSDSYSSR
ncbi:hypothetical protein M431DRAFT_513141 [Trichoderma harzianum CBS 226.95]|uniref:REJ domain-containing protein n=1 Tax=Trichoderma harzianum CBS 226.95 TaxID=983964 RepID=A0A2T3ZWI6_TRIHA|nr:hypothetical protein M431DRAFT_513141 [Trichoderma harzianum CBS 226.95]PTB49093.1 hypothetical protein M431DRAFT_513141 [Trichoderma harzianum CBS 226.95]